MKFKNTVIALTSIIFTSVLLAAELQHASDAEKPKLTTLKCKEFLAFEATYQPMIVYWASAYVQGDKPANAVLNIEATEQLVPVVIAECKTAPKASFWQIVKAKYKQVNF